MKKFLSIRTKLSFLVILGMGLTVSIIVGYSSYTSRQESRQQAEYYSIAQAERYKHEIKERIESAFVATKTITCIAEGIAKHAHGFNMDRESFTNLMKQVLMSNQLFLGVSACYEPNAFDGKDEFYRNKPEHDKTGRYIPYAVRDKNGEPSIEPLIEYDTNEAAAPWYFVPKRTLNDFLTEPIWYPIHGINVFMISNMVPLVVSGQFKGTIGIDLSIDFIQKELEQKKIYNGKADIAIISNGGTIIGYSGHKQLVGKPYAKALGENKQISKMLSGGVSQTWQRNDTLYIASALLVANTKLPWAVMIAVPTDIIYAHSRNMFLIQISIAFIFVVISILVLSYFVNRLIKPLACLVGITANIAEGKINTNMDFKHSNDEIGILSASILKMNEKLKEIITVIKTAAEQFQTSSREFNNGSQQIARGANEQASIAEEVSAAVEEMVSNIHQTASNATDTERIAQHVVKEVEVGSKSAQKTGSAMQEIADKVSIISEIAFQTNMLALNAAVEAAHAGQHGKGFSVVANEIRKLSEKSQLAAKEIGTLTQSSLLLSQKSAEQLEAIVPNIRNTAQLVDEIKSASLEEKIVADQVNNAINQLSLVIQQNAASSEEMAANSEELSSQAIQMAEMVSFFKLDEKQ